MNINSSINLKNVMHACVKDIVTITELIRRDNDNEPIEFIKKKDILLLFLVKIHTLLQRDIKEDKHPNLFYKDFQLFVFKSSDKKHHEMFDKTVFEILKKNIRSKTPIVIIEEMIIEELPLLSYKYLKDRNVLDYFNITVNIISFIDYQIEPFLKSNFNSSSEDQENYLDMVNKLYMTDYKIKFPKSSNLKYLSFEYDVKIDFFDFNYVYDNLIDLTINTSFVKKIPTKNNEMNYTLKHLKLFHTDIPYKSLDCFKALETLTYNYLVDVYELELIKIPSLKKLCLQRDMNEKYQLDKQTLKTSSLSDTLEWLEIHTNYNLEDDVGKLKHLVIKTNKNINCPNLEYLELKTNFRFDISYNLLKELKIKFMSTYTFNDSLNFPNLVSLELDNIMLSDNFSFSNLSKLENLKLNFKKCKTYNNNIFKNLASLRKLNLRTIELESNIFENVPNLIELTLNDLFTKLDNIEFNLPKLKYLRIESNLKYEITSKDLFSKLTLLETLVISGNFNTSVNIFSKLYSLKRLDLKYLIPSNLYNKFFVNLPNLRTINIFRSHFNSPNFSNIFSKLYSLRNLSIDPFYSNDILKGLTNLTYLKIKTTDEEFINLPDLPNLEFLDLTIPDRIHDVTIFKKLGNIKYLILNIGSGKEEAFIYFTKLNHLTLHTYAYDPKILRIILHNNKNLLTYEYKYTIKPLLV